MYVSEVVGGDDVAKVQLIETLKLSLKLRPKADSRSDA